MGNCLVTKLKGSVANNDILKLGEIRIKLKKVESQTAESQVISISGDNSTATIIGDGYFTDKTLTENKGKTISVSGDMFIKNNSDVEVSIISKYNIKNILPYYKGQQTSHVTDNKIINIDDLNYTKKLEALYMNGKETKGDLSSLKSLYNLKSIGLTNTSVTGDISYLSELSLLTELNLSNTLVSGNLSSISNLTNLKQLYIYQLPSSTQITGDLSSLKNLTSLKAFNLTSSTQITGDLSSLKNLTSLSSASTSAVLTGDLATTPSTLTVLQCSSQSKLSWSNRDSSAKIISILGNPFMENIDKMLQDQANCVASSSGSIVVKGTRTSASDAAVATLQSKGYTISITEV